MFIKFKESFLLFFGLFASFSTTFCCALPTILVTLGMGAAFAGLTNNFPFVIWLVERGLYLFIIATILLLISGYFIFIKKQTCPANKKKAKMCNKTKKINKIIWFISLIFLIIGFFFKYILILFL